MAGFLMALLMLAAGPAMAEVAVYTKGGMQVVGKAALLPRQKQGFARFKARARAFNGAYYISIGKDDGSFWVDEHRLEDAALAHAWQDIGHVGPFFGKAHIGLAHRKVAERDECEFH